MKIGITYDLRDDYLAQGCSLEQAAEFDTLETIEAIDHALQAQGLLTERIGNIHNLVNALTMGKRWDLVFNIAEGRFGQAREAQVPALLDAYQIPYVFSNPLILAIALDKGITKRIVRDHGLPTADFWVVKDLSDLQQHLAKFTFPLFVKPVAEGSSKGVNQHSQVNTFAQLQAACQLLWQEFQQPVLVETFLPGREFTIGLIGTGHSAEVLGVMEVTLKNNADSAGYTFLNKQEWRKRIDIKLADDAAALQAAQVALQAWQVLGCYDAGRIDIRLDASNTPCFLEVNPLAGLHPEDSDLVLIAKMRGLTYQQLLQHIIQVALLRTGVIAPTTFQQFFIPPSLMGIGVSLTKFT